LSNGGLTKEVKVRDQGSFLTGSKEEGAMGVRLITGKSGNQEVTVMYDSVTNWAFGPLFDSPEQAEAFQKWLEAHPKDSSECGKFFAGPTTSDPRLMGDSTLESAFAEFRLRIQECENCGEYHLDQKCTSAAV